jgi:ribokinase
MKKQGVLVVGSSNLDLVVTAQRFPKPGETIFGKKFDMFPGGKGANQAVCTARLGCKTTFIGKMGNDEFGGKLLKVLLSDGIDIKNIFIDENEHTGTALITVDSNGQNQIIVISGSNMKLTPNELKLKAHLFSEAAVVLTQLEIPLETVFKAAELAKENNAIFILNPAPVTKLPESLFPSVDYLIPNEIELELISGLKITDETSIRKACENLLNKGIKNIIVTLGSKGALLLNRNVNKIFPTKKVKVVDTTAAGDAFNGAFAYRISEGDSLDDAIEFANNVASLVVTRMGAQSSMPYLNEINNLLPY